MLILVVDDLPDGLLQDGSGLRPDVQVCADEPLHAVAHVHSEVADRPAGRHPLLDLLDLLPLPLHEADHDVLHPVQELGEVRQGELDVIDLLPGKLQVAREVEIGEHVIEGV